MFVFVLFSKQKWYQAREDSDVPSNSNFHLSLGFICHTPGGGGGGGGVYVLGGILYLTFYSNCKNTIVLNHLSGTHCMEPLISL